LNRKTKHANNTSQKSRNEKREKMADGRFRAGVLTISDRVSAGTAKDESGPALVSEIDESPSLNAVVVERAVVPDEKDQIKQKLIEWADEKKLDVIFTTGGTGGLH